MQILSRFGRQGIGVATQSSVCQSASGEARVFAQCESENDPLFDYEIDRLSRNRKRGSLLHCVERPMFRGILCFRLRETFHDMSFV